MTTRTEGSDRASGSPPSRTVLGLLVASFAMLALATDLIIASLPGIQRHFAITVGEAQQTLSVFVLVFAFAQLAYGPLSDRFGRRPTLMAGWALFALGSAVCAFAPSFGGLLAGRAVQGLGCCALTVVARATVRDMFGAEGTARMMGNLLALAAIAIVLSPVTGGFVEQTFGWRGNFILLAVVSGAAFALLAVVFRESNRYMDPTATHPLRLFGNYGTLLRNRAFVGYTLCVMFNYGAIMSYLSGSAFVLISYLGLAPRTFGILYGMCIMGYAVMSLYAARRVQRLGTARLMAIGTAIALGAGVVMVGITLTGHYSVAAILIPYFVYMLGNGLVNPSGTAGAVTPFPRMAGTASSFLGFLQLGFGALVGWLLGRFNDGTPAPMTISFGLCTLGMFLSYHLVVRGASPRKAAFSMSLASDKRRSN